MSGRYHLFEPGQTVFGGKYEIVAHRAQGGTANIYEAQQLGSEHHTVALKVALPSHDAEVEVRFFDEIANLSQLNQIERADIALDRRPHYIVLMLDFDRDEQYLAQEYIEGANLDDPGFLPLQDNLEKERSSEELALQITAQFCRVLTYLHNGLQSTYIDMKLENIWWIEAEDCIRVTDWNVIAPIAEDPHGVDRDLFNVGRYLAGMLLGAVPRAVSNSEALRRVNPLASIVGWKDITFGTQQLLLKALDTRIEERFQTAEAFETDLNNLLTLWRKNLREHDKLITESITTAQKHEANVNNANLSEEPDRHKLEVVRHAYEDAQTLLEIAVKKHGSALREAKRRNFERQISRGLDTSNLQNVGQELYLAGDFINTMDKFEEGLWRGNPLHFRRLLWMAHTGLDSGSSFKPYADTLLAAVEALNLNDFPTGLQLLQSIQGVMSSQHFSDLLLEAQAWVKLEQAEKAMMQGDYEAAIAAFTAASADFQQVGFTEWETEIPNIDGQVEECRAQLYTVEKPLEYLNEAVEAVNMLEIETIKRAYQLAYEANPDLDRDVLWDAIVEKSLDLLQVRKIDEAIRLLTVGNILNFAHTAIREQLELAEHLKDVQNLLLQSNFVQAANELVAIYALPYVSNLGDLLVDVTKRTFKGLSEHNHTVQARELHQLINSFNRPLAEFLLHRYGYATQNTPSPVDTEELDGQEKSSSDKVGTRLIDRLAQVSTPNREVEVSGQQLSSRRITGPGYPNNMYLNNLRDRLTKETYAIRQANKLNERVKHLLKHHRVTEQEYEKLDQMQRQAPNKLVWGKALKALALIIQEDQLTLQKLKSISDAKDLTQEQVTDAHRGVIDSWFGLISKHISKINT